MVIPMGSSDKRKMQLKLFSVLKSGATWALASSRFLETDSLIASPIKKPKDSLKARKPFSFLLTSQYSTQPDHCVMFYSFCLSSFGAFLWTTATCGMLCQWDTSLSPVGVLQQKLFTVICYYWHRLLFY